MFDQHRLARIGLVPGAFSHIPAVVAQGTYPTRPMKIIAPVQPGGGALRRHRHRRRSGVRGAQPLQREARSDENW